MLAFGHKRMVEFEGLNKIPRCANYVCSDDTFTAVFLSLDASIISSILILVLDKIMPFTIVIPASAPKTNWAKQKITPCYRTVCYRTVQ